MLTLSGLFILFLALPLFNIALNTTPSEFWRQIQDPVILDAVRVSFITSTVASIFGLIFGVPLAYVLARKNFPGKIFIDTLIDLPMVLPPSVAGLALWLILGPRTLVGSWLGAQGFQVLFTWRAIIVAQFFVASPFIVRSARAAIESVDVNLEKAARSLGAGRFYALRTVVLPMASGGIVAGWIMMWARAIGEFGATLMVSSNVPGMFPQVLGTYTLPTAIYLLFLWTISGAVACAIILLIIAFLFSILSKRLLIKRRK